MEKKKLVLTGREILALVKMVYADYHFDDNIEMFLEENEDISENESAELNLYDFLYQDFISTIQGYLKDIDEADDDLKNILNRCLIDE